MEGQRLVTEFKKSDSEMLKVNLQKFRGQDYIDIRAWIHDEKSGEYKPTPKGLTVNVELLPELISALEKAALVLDGARH